MNINEAFQKAVRNRMKRKGWSNYQLAQAAEGMAESSVYNSMRDGHRLSLVTACRLADALGVNIKTVITEAEALLEQ